MSTEQKRFEEWWDAKDDIPNNGPWTHDTPIQFAWAGWQAALAQPEQEQEGPICDGWQLSVADGHSGYGVYAHMDDYPDEGAVLILPIEQPAQPEQEPVDLSYQPDWKEEYQKAVLNKPRTYAEQQAADTAARDWLISIGSEPQ